MSSRKAHRKSRNGCLSCKSRHTKCGEEHPVCQNCFELELPCRYPPPNLPSVRSKLNRDEGASASASASVSASCHLSTCPHVSGVSGPHSQSSSGHRDRDRDPSPTQVQHPPRELRMTDINTSDLELLHHFSTSTYLTMSNDLEEQRICQTTIIIIGLRHTFLLRGLLALSALHLGYLHPSSDSTEYMVKASYHQNIGLADFRKVLDTINASTFDAILGFSCLLPIHSMAMAARSVSRPVGPNQDMLSAFLGSLSLIRSVNHLLLPSLQSYESSTLSYIFNATLQKLPEITSSYPGIDSIDRLSHTIAIYLSSQHASQSECETFSSTIQLLRSTLAHTLGNSSRSGFTIGSVLVWTVSISDEYCGFLNEGHPCALAILAHFAVLLSRHNGVWWLQGLGAAVINRINELLGVEWKEALEWTRDEAKL